MSAPTMRRLVLSFLTLACAFALPSTASAQEPASVRLTLLSQTPWNSTVQRELTVRLRAENLGTEPIGELSIGVTLFARVGSRSAYEASLITDPTVVIDAETLPREGALEPGQARDFELVFPMDSAGLDPDDSGIYPLKIDLRSGAVSLAALRSAAIFLVRDPEQPLSLSWTFVLHHPIEFGPDGAFTSSALETALEPGGVLAAQIQALLQLSSDATLPPVDVAISPVLLDQLDRMRGGYVVTAEEAERVVAAGEGGAQLATQALEDLRTIARSPHIRISALPFSSPELPALLSGGLARDVDVQIARGRELVGGLLEAVPIPTVLRPPGAAIDEPTLEHLSGTSISTLVAGPATVEPSPQPLGFAGPPTAALGDTGLTAIVPEPAVMALLQSSLTETDPVLASQVLLGELAAIWQEQPGVPRGMALVVSEDLVLPPAFFGAFTRAIAGAPWLAPMHAGEFAVAFPPAEPSLLTAPVPRRFSSTYVAELKQARRRIATYRSMLLEPSEEPDRFDTMLLLAESRQYLSNPDDGLAFITSVQDAITGVFDSIAISSAEVITLTSSTGAGVPVTVTNGAAEALRVTVRLESPYLRSSPAIDLALAAGDSETVTFRVDLRSTGRFPVLVQVLAPGGRILQEEELSVRSTVYNRIALLITIAAAVVLLGLWARRFLPRRTS
jgi:hypothetical protein